MNKDVHPNNEVIVIGAGASGLAVARELQINNVPVRIIEKANGAGDAWVHRHPQLRLNTHRHLSKLPGMSIPKTAGAFPSRDSILQYLQDYAAKLHVPIDYGVTVLHIKQSISGSLWQLETSEGSYIAAHVIIATGYDRIPYIPKWAGRHIYQQKLVHSADFGELQQYQNKRILVVGAGNSGSDILNHLATISTNKVWASVRHGPVVFPTRLWGIPVHRLSPVFSMLPLWLVDKLLSWTERWAFGDLRKWGLTKHSVGGASRLLKTGTAPAVDNGFIAALKAGKIHIVPEIKELDPYSVRLTDGRRIDPDIIIAATGYRTGLESIIGHLGVLTETGNPTFEGAVQHPRTPGLWFTGMQPVFTGFFHAAGKNAKAIAKAIIQRREKHLPRTSLSQKSTHNAVNNSNQTHTI